MLLVIRTARLSNNSGCKKGQRIVKIRLWLTKTSIKHDWDEPE